MATAAIVVVVSFIGLNQSNRKEFLYKVSQVEAPYYMLVESRGEPDRNAPQNSKRFEEAMTEYSQKNYVGALSFLNQIPETETNPQVTFFKGICLLYTDKPKDSILQLDKIILEMNPSYYDEALYYKAVALLRSGEEKNALDHLDNLAGMFSPLSGKAKALIAKINES